MLRQQGTSSDGDRQFVVGVGGGTGGGEGGGLDVTWGHRPHVVWAERGVEPQPVM